MPPHLPFEAKAAYKDGLFSCLSTETTRHTYIIYSILYMYIHMYPTAIAPVTQSRPGEFQHFGRVWGRRPRHTLVVF